jgi:hypothetical protein
LVFKGMTMKTKKRKWKKTRDPPIGASTNSY